MQWILAMGLADLLGIADLHCRKVESTKWLTLKTAGGGCGMTSVADMACMPSIFIKTSQIFFVESCWISAFTKKFFGKLRLLEVGPRGR